MFGNFTEDARRVLNLAKKEMKDLKHPYISSEHLLLAILKDKNLISEEIKEELTYETFRKEVIHILGVGEKECEYFLYTPLLKRILENAVLDSKENNNGNVTIHHLFSSLLEEGEGVAVRILLGMKIDVQQWYQKFSFKLINKKGKRGKKLVLEELGINLNEKVKSNLFDPVIGREKELQRMMEILSRKNKNNPLLIGAAGCGKTALVEKLASKIEEDEVPEFLKGKKIFSLDMASAVAGTKYRGEFEERIRKILKECEENEDIILFIDEVHTLVGAGGAEGAIDASNIFKPALARGKIRCIGATTIEEYKKFIETDKALERRFQKILVEEPSKEELTEILLRLKPIYENYHHVKMDDSLIEKIMELSKKYVYDRREPDRSIDLLDEVCARVGLRETTSMKQYQELRKKQKKIIQKKKEAILQNDFGKASSYKEEENKIEGKCNTLFHYIHKMEKKVTLKDLALVVHEKTKIPIYEILKDNKKVIEKLSKDLKNTILGQEEAIHALLKLATKMKLGYTDHKCHSILFTGPSGVGKTCLAKTFAKSLVGEKNTIKLDMSEFSESHSISKFIGSPPGYVGYENAKTIAEEIKDRPYSVLILDEIEKAHPAVLNLFYQILDDSKLTDTKGNEVRFDHVTIIMTSNVGFLENHIGFQKQKKNNLQENFELPFLNRIDATIAFEPLNETFIGQIISKELKKVKEKYPFVKINKKIISELIPLSEYEIFGARKIEKVIKDKIENQILEAMMRGEETVWIESVKETIKV